MVHSLPHNLQYQSSQESKTSQMKMLNNNGPKIDPCGTPNNFSLHEVDFHLFLRFVLYLSGNYVLILKNFIKTICT